MKAVLFASTKPPLGECQTTDRVMQSVAGRPWDLWKSKVLGGMK